jgi:hypothetical protein
MERIILLKAPEIDPTQAPIIQRCLLRVENLIRWTVDWEDTDKVMRLVFKSPESATPEMVIKLLESYNISAERLID